MKVRRLTEGERALAAEVFGPALDPAPVRLVSAPWPFRRAFVPGRCFGRDWIVWPSMQFSDDVSGEPLRTQALLIHELVHVWQAQQGVNLLFAKLRAGDAAAAYRYPIDDGCHWRELNIEQQASLVEHAFRQSRGGTAPAAPAFYQRVRAPFAPASRQF